jgi:hypothetical protein
MIRRLLGFVLLSGLLLNSVHLSLAQGSTGPTVTSFTSDLQSITPDQAESGTQYANLAWTTAGLSASDLLYLQVYVLDEWHDVRPEALPANGTLRWAVAHTLDFAPPRFRLVIRNSAHADVSASELVIPYTTHVDPADPPRITWFSAGGAPAPAGLLSVFWEIRNRPARANLRFMQVFGNGRVEKIELPRARQWINSRGQGNVRPVISTGKLQLRLEIFDIDTGQVYDQYTLTLSMTPDGVLPAPPRPTATIPTPTPGGPRPQILTFQVDRIGLNRGETVTVSWQTRGASSASIEIYDIDYFPYHFSRPPTEHFQNLQPSGELRLGVPKDYPGNGYQIHLHAESNQPGSLPAIQRIDILFVDAPQPIRLNIGQFEITPQPIRRGSTANINWNTTVTRRGIDPAGKIGWVATHAYDHQIWLRLTAIYSEGNSPGNALNARFDRQALSGLIQWVVPDFDPAFTNLWVEIGLNVDGQDITYDVRNYALALEQARTESLYAAYQAFERGFMIWNSKTGEVFVYTGSTSGNLQSFVQNEYAGLSDNPVADNPPPGKVKPINAFGRVWGNYEFIRNALGWATSPEQAYTMTLTYGTRQPAPDVTVTLPNGSIHRLGGTWTATAH